MPDTLPIPFKLPIEPVITAESQDQTPQLMLVEDEIVVAMDMQQRLELLGYKVVACVTTGEDALHLPIPITST